jgi:hypothetical protein
LKDCSKRGIEKLHQIEKVVFPPQFFIRPGMVIISVQCSICKEGYGNATISQAKHTWEDFAERVTDIIFLHVALVSYIHLTRNPYFRDLAKWPMEGFVDLERERMS